MKGQTCSLAHSGIERIQVQSGLDMLESCQGKVGDVSSHHPGGKLQALLNFQAVT